jgi:ATP-binding cassette subfamily B protein
VIAHRLTTVDLADRIYVLSGGRIVGAGTKEQLTRECAEYRRMAAGDVGGDDPLAGGITSDRP